MTTISNRLFTKSVRLAEAFLRTISPRLYWKLMPRLAEEMNLYYRDDDKTAGITFYVASDVSKTRAETLLSKEPDTIEWLDGLNAGDVFWDIGANIGVYSLYAAAKRNCRVLAFEPSPFNYFALCKNVHANNLGSAIQPYMFAVGDQNSIAELYMGEHGTGIGGAGSSFGQNIDNRGDRYTAALTQFVVGTSIDDFIKTFGATFPNHIKIDVDGNQESIAAGMVETIKDPRVKSIMFELLPETPDTTKRIHDQIVDSGFHQVQYGNVTSANHFYLR